MLGLPLEEEPGRQEQKQEKRKPRQDPGNNYVQYCLQKNLAPIEQNRIR